MAASVEQRTQRCLVSTFQCVQSIPVIATPHPLHLPASCCACQPHAAEPIATHTQGDGMMMMDEQGCVDPSLALQGEAMMAMMMQAMMMQGGLMGADGLMGEEGMGGRYDELCDEEGYYEEG